MPRKISVETFFAHLISVLFHPLLMPEWVFVAITLTGFYAGNLINPAPAIIYGLMIAAITFLAPAAVFLILRYIGMLSSLQMPRRRERQIPILITSFFLYSLVQWSKNWDIDPFFRLYMLVASLLGLLAFIINYRWKISLHTLGAGAFVGCLASMAYFFNSLYFWLLPPAVLIAGAIAYARLRLNAHSQAEVYAGFLTGFGTVFAALGLLISFR